MQFFAGRIGAILFGIVLAGSPARGSAPIINAVTISNNQLRIVGTGFTGKTAVSFNGKSIPVVNPTTSQLVATLDSAPDPGTYRLVVGYGNSAAVSYVTVPSEPPAQSPNAAGLPEPRSKTLADWLVGFATLLLAAATLALVLIARSSDRAYHTIADIAERLANIAQRQTDIASSTDRAFHTISDVARQLANTAERQVKLLAASDRPVIQARIESIIGEAGNVEKDRLIVVNIGAPVSEVKVEWVSYFQIRFWGHPNHVEVESRFVATNGYYPGGFSVPTGTTIYETIPSAFRQMAFEIYKASLNKQINGSKTLVDLLHVVHVLYRTRTQGAQSGWFAVDELGSKEMMDADGQRARAIYEKSVNAQILFDFADGPEKFWEIVERIAPPFSQGFSL
jgi:hypothetical protein